MVHYKGLEKLAEMSEDAKRSLISKGLTGAAALGFGGWARNDAYKSMYGKYLDLRSKLWESTGNKAEAVKNKILKFYKRLGVNGEDYLRRMGGSKDPELAKMLHKELYNKVEKGIARKANTRGLLAGGAVLGVGGLLDYLGNKYRKNKEKH